MSRQMAAFYEWKVSTDTRIEALEEKQVEVESRLDETEARSGLYPGNLRTVRATDPHRPAPTTRQGVCAAGQQATGKHSATIYTDLYTAFGVPRYQDLPESEWEHVERWFAGQIERRKQK